MSTHQLIILAIMIAYLVLNILVGVWVSKREAKKSVLNAEKQYFIGSRGMGGFVLSMTTMATFTSISSFISAPGSAGMSHGYVMGWCFMTQCIAVITTIGVVGNRMAIISRRTGCVTIAGFLKARYKSDVVVILTSLIMVVFFTVQTVAQFTGGATLIASVTNLPHVPALAIFGLVVIIYTAIGGFTAVVITDTIQGVVMLAGTFLFMFFVLRATGGLDTVNTVMEARIPTFASLTGGALKHGSLVSYWVLCGIGSVALPQCAVRGMGFKSTRSLRRAIVFGTISCSIIMFCLCTAGVWAGSLVNPADLPTSDYMVPMVAQMVMPSAVAGLFMAAPLAAVMSTVSSFLILASATIIKELWRTYVIKDDPVKVERYNKNFSKISFIGTLVVGLVAMVIAMDPPDIVVFLNLFAVGGLMSTFMWPTIGGLFYKKGTWQGALSSTIAGVATYLYCHFNGPVLGLHAVVWGLLSGAIVYFAVSNATCRNGQDPEILEACF